MGGWGGLDGGGKGEARQNTTHRERIEVVLLLERDQDRREPSALRKADDGMERPVVRDERRNMPHRRRDILTQDVLVRVNAPVRVVWGRAD